MNDIILNAIRESLLKEFPKVFFYKNGTVTKYPSFYLLINEVFSELVGLQTFEMYQKSFYLRIEYRIDADPSSIDKFNSKMNEDGFKILKALRRIKIQDHYYIPEFTTNEVIDNIKIVEFNIKIFVKYKGEEYPKMKRIEIDGGIK